MRHSPLKITTQPAGERELSLVIEVDEERIERARRQTARQISTEVDIPGFRKGKAPYEVVVQRLGEPVVQQELVALLAEDVYPEALEEEDVTPYAPGTLEETTFDPLTLTFKVPLVPEVNLGDYRELRVDAPELEVPEETVGEALEAIRRQNAVLAPLDRPADEGDLLVAEIIGRTTDGLEFLHDEEARVVLDPEHGASIPGLIDGLIGLTTGEERNFTLVIPEDFEVEDLAGREAEFEIRVDTVYERILPELDDDLARTVGNYESFDELEESVRDGLREKERARVEGEYAEQVLEAVVEQAEISYPSVMLEERVDDAIENYKREIERREHMMLEDYLRIQGTTMDELREEMVPEVEASLKRSLVLGEIVEQEGLEIEEEALDAQIAESSEQYGDRADEVRAVLREPERRRSIRNRMLANVGVQRLVKIAKGELEQEGAATEEAGAGDGEGEAEEAEDSGA